MNRVYKFHNSKVKQKTKLFLISDLHYQQKKDLKKFQFILEEIKTDPPDFLCIAGDLLDSAIVEEEHQLLNFLEKCANLVTIVLCIGNHDVAIHKRKTIYYYHKPFWETLKEMKNVIVLDNQNFEYNNICFIGLTLPFSYYYDTKENPKYLLSYLKKLDWKPFFDNTLNILLVHSTLALVDPMIIEQIPFLKTMDFIVSGHTHNGLVPKRLEPFFHNNGIISPFKKIYPKLVRGNFQIGKTEVIISGGITKLSQKSHLEKLDRFWKRELTKIIILPD